MGKILLIALLPMLLLFGNGPESSFTGWKEVGRSANSGILEKMIVANGRVVMDLDLARLNGPRAALKNAKSGELTFDAERDSFFTVLVFNDELRGPTPGSISLIPQNLVALPQKLGSSLGQLVLESSAFGKQYELAVRDAKTGFAFFNIEGHLYDYDAGQHLLTVANGRLLLSKEFATAIGRPSDAGANVGTISADLSMRDIEVSQIVNNEVRSDVMPSVPSVGSVPGPDVIVGDLNGLTQFEAASGTKVGLAVGTDSCNLGTIDLDWFAAPDNDHPVIPQNMYRMSGGANNDERFEQIGQSSVKHAFEALMENICSLGCDGVGDTHLGSGCSDPYVASLNSGGFAHSLGSRAWINPFTGAYPRADSVTPPNDHTGHVHDGTSHRILVEINDLSTALNPGATYYAEAMYVTPHEYTWCQSHAGQCNMYNNVSYRQYLVSGTDSPFSFSTGTFSTQRTKAAITAWTGSTQQTIEPAPGVDGIGTVAYKVTNPTSGVWHYEYAVYNQNLDRAIQSFSVAIGAGASISNVGFHAPPQQPAWPNDGTLNNAGFSGAAWAPAQNGTSISWASETFAQNQNASAIRWGTLYNFRFDSNRPPQTANATIGFFKTGAPITISVQGPSPATSNATVTGRVFTASGIPLRGATVSIRNQADGTGLQTALTTSFGYYTFTNVPIGATYTITIRSKRNLFTPVVTTINGDLFDLNIFAQPDP